MMENVRTGTQEEQTAAILACPACGGRLAWAQRLISCLACQESYPQNVEGVIDLLPSALRTTETHPWQERQQEMESWYRRLMSRPIHAQALLTRDYAPFADILAQFSGSILDLGGGSGFTRRYLPSDVHYVIVDPSLDWRTSAWQSLASAGQASFVRGVGESLAFVDEAFDAVLAFWSLNHVSRPEKVLGEVGRVLKPGGRFLAVLEDMEPSRHDLAGLLATPGNLLGSLRLMVSKVRSILPGMRWPVQSDHLRIVESDLAGWAGERLTIERRVWIGQYLTYEFRRV